MKYQQAIKQIQATLDARQPRQLGKTDLTAAAIVIPIFSKDDAAHLLFTVRTDKVLHHKGQVSFPGGAREAQDRDLVQTALRETREEVGIPENTLHVIGQLDDFPTITDFLVTPFVATMPYPYPHQINTDEVAEILEVPLSLFLSEAHFELKEKTFGDKSYPVYYYYYQHAVIWGVTGFIINRFVELAFGFNPAGKSVLSDPRNEQYLRENIYRTGIRSADSDDS